MVERLRVAVIGAGRIAERGHLPGYVMAGAEVVALCGVDPVMLAQLGDKFGVQRQYTDWREMLKEGGFDAVSICTPPIYHAEMAVESARAGYHVLVEKPMALSLAECDQMIEAAHAANVMLMIGHNQRFSMRHVLAKEVLCASQLGKPYQVHASFRHGGPEAWSPRQQWYFDGKLAGYGVISDLGIHKIDLLRWLLDQDVVAVMALIATNEKPTTADDTAVLALRFSGGTLATMQLSWAFRPGNENTVSISCEHGTLEIPTTVTEPVRVRECRKSGLVVDSTLVSSAAETSGWLEEIAAFVDAVTHGQPSPVPGQEGKKALAAMLAAYEAIARKSIVEPQS